MTSADYIQVASTLLSAGVPKQIQYNPALQNLQMVGEPEYTNNFSLR